MKSDGYKSRKFWMTVALSVTFTWLVKDATLDQDSYVKLMGGLVLFFTAGNVSEKFVK